jgi:hypothetical protein
VQDCILESEGDPEGHPGFSFDSGNSVLSNSLVIAHNAFIGVFGKYDYTVAHSTIINPDATVGSVGLQTFSQNYGPGGSTVTNTAIFGFAHATAYNSDINSSYFLVPDSNYNATDVSASDNTATWVYNTANYHAFPLPGANTLFSLSQAATFVSTSDFRLKSTSSLRGAGAAFGPFDGACWPNTTACAVPYVFNTDTPDIIGTTRPQSSAYDIGAAQFVGSGTAPGARLLWRR